jgi:hypothetical protein
MLVRRMYAECKVKVKVGKEERDIEYITGVQQGEHFAPILFLCLMLAVSSTLRKICPYRSLEFGHFPSRLWSKSGRFRNQATKTWGILLTLLQILFVDDSTFIFDTEIDTVSASQLIHGHYARFGILMHVGRNGKKSKTEAIHFPKGIHESPIQLGAKVPMQDVANFHYTDGIQYLGSWIRSNLWT